MVPVSPSGLGGVSSAVSYSKPVCTYDLLHVDCQPIQVLSRLGAVRGGRAAFLRHLRDVLDLRSDVVCRRTLFADGFGDFTNHADGSACAFSDLAH